MFLTELHNNSESFKVIYYWYVKQDINKLYTT
jgi:hypothetical protein